MSNLILMIFLGMRAHAGCELQTTAKGKTLTAPLVIKQSDIKGIRYEAAVNGFQATVDFNRVDKSVSSQITGPAGEAFNYKTSGTEIIEELDCFGGSTGGLEFRFKCDSREWRAMKLRNGWEGKWCSE